jgi:hypothetical protein
MVKGAPFFLSHGATFFCPHPYDVKLIGRFGLDALSQTAQSILCMAYFSTLKDPEASIKFALRPTLPINGLPSKTGSFFSFFSFF